MGQQLTVQYEFTTECGTVQPGLREVGADPKAIVTSKSNVR